MFTGIVIDVGRLRSIDQSGDTRFEIETGLDMAPVGLGASIACSGVCLTVVEKGSDWFAANASAETLSKTTLGDWKVGRRINLEPSLKLGDELGGHMVSGHVDGIARCVGRQPEGDSIRFRFAVPHHVAPFVAAKGSVSLDGVSLTVNDVHVPDSDEEPTVFGVNIIPHTASVTTFGQLEPEDWVNLEIDLIARYVSRLLEARGGH
ncbi:MAG: riboflavin synthase [Pseudomonadota bacterium]